MLAPYACAHCDVTLHLGVLAIGSAMQNKSFHVEKNVYNGHSLCGIFSFASRPGGCHATKVVPLIDYARLH
jgi:hypothetical protein